MFWFASIRVYSRFSSSALVVATPRGDLCTTLVPILVFCEDSPSVGQVGVRESQVTSHFSPITLVAACRAVFLLRLLSSSSVETLGNRIADPEFAKFDFESLPFRRATHQTNLTTTRLWEISEPKHRKGEAIDRILNPNRAA